MDNNKLIKVNTGIGRVGKQIVITNKLLQSITNNEADIYNKSAHAKFKLEDYDGAIEDWKKVLQLKGDDSIIYFNIGLSFYNIGTIRYESKKFPKAICNYIESILNYDKAIQLKIDYKNAYANRSQAKRMSYFLMREYPSKFREIKEEKYVLVLSWLENQTDEPELTNSERKSAEIYQDAIDNDGLPYQDAVDEVIEGVSDPEIKWDNKKVIRILNYLDWNSKVKNITEGMISELEAKKKILYGFALSLSSGENNGSYEDLKIAYKLGDDRAYEWINQHIKENSLSELTVTVGNQNWMIKNLDIDQYRNGDKIPEIKDADEWEQFAKEGKGCWCYYNNDPENGKKYGKLYNWHAINDKRLLAPEGWHIPSEKEFEELINNTGVGKEKAGINLKAKFGWNPYSNDITDNVNGKDLYLWRGLPSGLRSEKFIQVGKWGRWWSTSKNEKGEANCLCITHFTDAFIFSQPLTSGISVRCIKDM